MSETPKLPDYTCPLIDMVKDVIDKAYSSAESADSDMDSDSLYSLLTDIRFTLAGETRLLEDIRVANTQLRECAEYWEQRCLDAMRLEAVEKALKGGA
jgi:hypothetical protein